jgi:hypothetical protein
MSILISNIEPECFEIKLQLNYFDKGDIITLENEVNYEVVDTPRTYTKWYQRLLRWLSRGKWCKNVYTYKVKLKK